MNVKIDWCLSQNNLPNQLPIGLPRDEYEHLLPNLESVRLPRNRILHEAGDIIHHAYFLNTGIASLLAITEEGRTIELGVVGNDGYIGVPWREEGRRGEEENV